MTEVHKYDGGSLSTVREGTIEYRQSAELGAVGGGSVTIDDTPGTQDIVGQKDWEATQDDCSRPLLFRGYVADRTYSRKAGIDRAPNVAAARGIEVELVDTNAMLGFRLIDGEDGNRPRETIEDRATWILGSDYVSGLFSDLGRCSFSSSIEMTKSDYRNQYPGDVIADMALAAGGGTNYHVNDYGSGPELTFRNDNTSTADSSTLRISNVLADASAVTLNPFMDATLRRSPANVYSKIAFSNAKTTVYEERTATATAFNGERGGQASNSNVNTSAEARTAAQDLLKQHASEEDIIECTVLATSAQVNLMPPGWRIQGKFSHLNTEGYGSFTWFRILEVGKKPIVADGGLYEVRLKLSPQETFPLPGDCVDLYTNTPSATYYPLGHGTDLYAPADSDGVVYYTRGGTPIPPTPTPGWPGGGRTWHFPRYGNGGAGSIDYAGDCAGNHLELMTVGNGTWTIQTERYVGQVRRLGVRKGPYGLSAHVAYINSGDSIEVEIDDATDGDCIRIVSIGDASWPTCGGAWGWSGAEWELAP